MKYGIFWGQICSSRYLFFYVSKVRMMRGGTYAFLFLRVHGKRSGAKNSELVENPSIFNEEFRVVKLKGTQIKA